MAALGVGKRDCCVITPHRSPWAVLANDAMSTKTLDIQGPKSWYTMT